MLQKSNTDEHEVGAELLRKLFEFDHIFKTMYTQMLQKCNTDEHEVGVELFRELFEFDHVAGDVLTDSRVGASTSLCMYGCT